MLTRREFLKLCFSSAALTLSGVLLPKVVEALNERDEKVTVIWLEMMTCSGDFMSFLNTMRPDVEQLLEDTLRLEYQNTLMSAEGEQALDHLMEVAQREEGKFILVAEGTVPTRDQGAYGNTGVFEDGRPFRDIEALKFLGPRAKHIIAIGACASFGGPYSARPNPSRSLPVHKVLKGVPVINVPGCPAHPDWFVGTLSHVILYGMPEVDAFGRPTMFYDRLIHSFCPKRQHFENGIFAKHPGDEGCLFKIGCKGPVTYSDCPTRQWNSAYINWPIGANTPCIGCASPEFPDRMSPFFEHLEDVKSPLISVRASTAGKVVLGAAAAGIGGHAIAGALTGRIHKHMVEGSESPNVDEGILEHHRVEEEDRSEPEEAKSTEEASEEIAEELTPMEEFREASPSRATPIKPKKLRKRDVKRREKYDPEDH